jgi:LAGLIDADG DNA endonuclease family
MRHISRNKKYIVVMNNDIDYSNKNSSKVKISKLLVMAECKNKGPNNKLLKKYKESLKSLSSFQQEIIIGLILGDASLQSQNNGKTYRVKFEWGDKNKLYAEHVHTIFDEWVLNPLHKKVRININNNTVITWGFQTISHSSFNFLHDFFLVKKTKGVITNLVKDHLTEIGLAYWFMDDGGKLDYNKNSTNKGIVLNTHSFTEEEVNNMASDLNEKFHLNTYVKLNKNKYIIVIKSESFNRFLDLTYKHIIPEMRYKLPT